MPLKRISIPSPNYSSRSGANVRLIVLHTAEGALTYQSLGSFFANPASQVSSHVGVDDTPNTIGEYVAGTNKAWTAANANPIAVQAELCAFAAWTPSQWSQHPNMLANLAQWIAEEAAAFNIPIVKLTPQAAQGNGRGVCQHRDLGAWGGGHTDCGDGFPIDDVLRMATGGAPAPAPTPPFPYYYQPGSEEGTLAICTHPNGKRIDLVSINTDGTVNHTFTDDNADWSKAASENMGGVAKSVSCCWLDGNRFQVVVHGANDRPWQNLSTNGRWGGWIEIPGITLQPPK